MYEDLADAIESLKEKGYDNSFTIENQAIECTDLGKKFAADELKIVKKYNRNLDSDPGSEATVYALVADDGTKGIMVIGFGMYSDPQKSRIINELLKNSTI